MTNTSGLLPCGRAVLVRPYQPEVKASTIILPDSVKLSGETIEQRAVVVAIGPAAWHEERQQGYGNRAEVGDKVLISKFAGHMAQGTKDGEQYRFVNDRDIFAKIEVE
jgi:co-chaperonin GroES (HSP10)